MSFMKTNPTFKDENDAFTCALQVTSSYIVPMVLKAAFELGLLDIIAKKGQISPSKMASHFLAKNKDALTLLGSVLRLLATHSILTCSLRNLEEGGGGEFERLYRLPPAGELLVQEVGCCSRLLTSFFQFSNIRNGIDFYIELVAASLLKWILHNWDDEQCLKILKNCYEAIPTSAKIILVEYIGTRRQHCQQVNFST
ncbi:hypothetical protein LguiA_018161 [Lonicera macranthoides]